ncbi:MAG: hypothetical protein AAF171_09055, partial [Cyanobacteria bacterium P01_A01_bin.116]
MRRARPAEATALHQADVFYETHAEPSQVCAGQGPTRRQLRRPEDRVHIDENLLSMMHDGAVCRVFPDENNVV